MRTKQENKASQKNIKIAKLINNLFTKYQKDK